MENVRKERDTKLAITEKRRKCFVSEPNFHIRKFFRENLLATEMKQNLILENKSVYLDFSILELSKILIIYEFWYDYVKPKYVKKSKLCYMIIFSFILYIKRDNAYKDIEFFFFLNQKLIVT